MECLIFGMEKLLGRQKYNLSNEKLLSKHDTDFNWKRIYRAKKGANKTLDYSNKEMETLRLGLLLFNKNKIANLKLNGNYLRTIPWTVASFHNLKEVYLQYNNFEYIPPQIWTFKLLEVLDLSFNSISSIPSNVIQDLKCLKKLNFSYNKLNSLPDDLSYSKSLHEVYLEGNKFVQIPPSLLDLGQLQVLQMNQNALSYVPKDLTHLTSLQELHINHNPIVSLHVHTIQYLSQLQLLDASKELQMKLHIALLNENEMALKLPRPPL